MRPCPLCNEQVCPVCHKCMNPTCPNIECKGAMGKVYDCRYLVEKDLEHLKDIVRPSRKKNRCHLLMTVLMAFFEIPFIPWFIYQNWQLGRR